MYSTCLSQTAVGIGLSSIHYLKRAASLTKVAKFSTGSKVVSWTFLNVRSPLKFLISRSCRAETFSELHQWSVSISPCIRLPYLISHYYAIKLQWVIYSAFGTATAIDFVIAGSMFYYLKKGDVGFIKWVSHVHSKNWTKTSVLKVKIGGVDSYQVHAKLRTDYEVRPVNIQ